MLIGRKAERVLTRTSNCRIYKNQRQNATRGFTLVEILVVLFLISVMTGMVVVNMPSFTQTAEFDREARRLELLLQMARTEAVLDSIEYGFKPTDRGYMFFRYDDALQSWQQAGEPFHEREFSDEIRLRVRADNGALRLSGDSVPPVLILSSGETTPFEMELESKLSGKRKTLTTDGYGNIAWQTDE